MAITAAQVKELRERTAAGMMDCKKALQEADGDMDLAIENMRKNGQAKAAKKAGNIAAEGQIIIKDGTLVEVNCQTDFVAKDDNFLAFANKVAEVAAAEKLSIEDLQAKFEEERIALVTKIGENINVRRVAYVEGTTLASYKHGATIGVVVAGEGDAEALKHIAMHVAASAPEYVSIDDIPAEISDEKKAEFTEKAKSEGKPEKMLVQIVDGMLKKYFAERCLLDQPFIKNPDQTVGDMVKEANAQLGENIVVRRFSRIQLGEVA